MNQIVTAAGISFTHDWQGNTTAAGSKSYGYDDDNRLISASGGGLPSTTLEYDPAGRLSRYAVSGTPQRYQYAGDQLIADYNDAGASGRRYVPGAGVDETLIQYESTGGLTNKRWLVQDARGSLIAITGSTGSASFKNQYDPYGAPASTNAGRFGYTGQIWLADIGLYHYKARAYNPETGRFMQPDPIGYAGGMNLYAYVGNDPINFVDPSGLAEKQVDDQVLVVCDAECQARGQFGANLAPTSFSATSTGGGGGGGNGNVRQICITPTGSRISTCFYVKKSNREECDVPFAPAGVSVDVNIAIAESHSNDPWAFKLEWFYSMVRNGADWDYKQIDKDYWRPLIDSGSASQHPFEEFGNFNFGATAEAAGIDFEFAEKAAGWAQREAGTSRPEFGQPGFPFPNSPLGAEGFYGNDPRDYFDSLRGLNYAQNCR